MNRVRMAVVGVGALGRHHARILSTFEDVDLVAVADTRPEQGRQIAADFGTRWTPDPADLHGAVDAAVVATPTCTHTHTAAPLIRAGISLLVEKPLADSCADAEALTQAADAAGVTLQVGHVERFNPAFRSLQEACQNPRYIRAQRVSPYAFRSMDIGVVHDLMIHDIDLVLALAGEMPVRVEAFGGTAVGPNEDMAVARLTFPGGTVADLTASRLAPQPERTLQVFWETGAAVADLHARKIQRWQLSDQLSANPSVVAAAIAAAPNPTALKDNVFGNWIESETTQASDADALTAELREFVDSVRGITKPCVDGVVATQALRVAEQILNDLKPWQSPVAAAATTRSAAAA